MIINFVSLQILNNLKGVKFVDSNTKVMNGSIDETNYKEQIIDSKSETKVVEKRPFGSLDLEDIDRPMRILEECMQRLEMQHALNEKAAAEAALKNSEDDDTSSPSTSEDDPLYRDSNSDPSPNDDTAIPMSQTTTLNNPSNSPPFSSSVERPSSLELPINNLLPSSNRTSTLTSCDLDNDDDDDVLFTPPDKLLKQINAISLNWQSLQNVSACVCTTPLEPYSTKLHCYACGQIYCVRCVEKRAIIPGYSSSTERNVCTGCLTELRKTTS